MLAENTLVQNRYLVKNLIGKGGMGAVYLAEDTRFNNRVIALKEMVYTNNSKLETAFGREANLLAHLHHPRLSKVSDFFKENGFQYLVMEYVSGDDLGNLLTKIGKPFPVNRVLKWADSLLDILEYLHAQNPPIIHRDIKPQNLKLNSKDEIILLDFGLAKDNLTYFSQIASSNSLLGFTPNYAPLEQIRGDLATVQTDLYSVSATIYHLLTKTPPVSSLVRVQAKVDENPDPLIPAHLINAEIPVKLSEVLTQGLSLKRESRFSSAAEMRKRIKEIFDEPGKFNAAAQYPVLNNQSFSQENIKTISVSSPIPVRAAGFFADSEASKPVFSQPAKPRKRGSAILFGVLICVLGLGIVMSYFVGQWLSAKMSSDSRSDEANTSQGVSNKTETSLEVAPKAVSAANSNPAADSPKPENKPVVDAKNVPQKKPDKPAAPKPVQSNKPSTSKEGKSEIFQ